jgi:hypothetical protein
VTQVLRVQLEQQVLQVQLDKMDSLMETLMVARHQVFMEESWQ